MENLIEDSIRVNHFYSYRFRLPFFPFFFFFLPLFPLHPPPLLRAAPPPQPSPPLRAPLSRLPLALE